MENNQEKIINILSRKGYIETFVQIVKYLINKGASFCYATFLRIRGYNIDYKTNFGGANQLFQSYKGHIAVGKKSRFGKNTRVDAGFDGKIIIGNNVLIDDHCFITAQKSITIGHDVMIAAYSFITDFNHAFSSKKKHIDQQGFERSPVIIEDDVWIGTHVCILKGVTVGRGAVIGAGSVVTRNVKPYEVVAGNPAKHIRYRT